MPIVVSMSRPACPQPVILLGCSASYPTPFVSISSTRLCGFFKHIYKQRTATERINAQAVALGIERPKLRNRQAITNQNTLIYVLINLRALHRVRQQKQEAATT